MPTMIDPTMTADERLDTLVTGAHAAIEAGHDDLALTERRSSLYSRAAAYFQAYATREEAYAAFQEADAAFKAAQQPPHAHDDDVLQARDLIARGVEMLDLATFDGRRDPAALRVAAAIFADLAAAG